MNIRSTALFASIALMLACTPVSAAGEPAADTPSTAAAKVTVQVIGRVTKPGDVVLDSGARLSDALSAAGAFAIEKLVARLGGTPLPDTECTPGGAQQRYVFLSRATESSKPMNYAIDFALVRQHDPRYDMLLRANDKIYVPDCRSLTQPRFPIPQFEPQAGVATAGARTPTRAS